MLKIRNEKQNIVINQYQNKILKFMFDDKRDEEI